MKNLFYASALATVFPLAFLQAAEPVVSTVKFSHPEKPEIVRINVGRGSVRVSASDSKDAVTVSTTARSEHTGKHRADGLRVIGSGTSYLLAEDDNVVNINYGGSHGEFAREADFAITVPKQASLQINSGPGGELSVDGVSGDLEIKNINGEVELSDVGGGAVVETMNGGIKAKIASLLPGKALSFTSMNGQVELHLPSNAKANLRFRTQNGTILTDFPDDVLKTKAEPSSAEAPLPAEAVRMARDQARQEARAAREAAREASENQRKARADTAGPATPELPTVPPTPVIPSMVGGNVVSGTLNGGGVDVFIATMNGDIVVRTTTAKP